MNIDAMMQNIKPLRAKHSSEEGHALAQAFHRLCGTGIPFLLPKELDRVLAETPDVAVHIANHARLSEANFEQGEQVWDLEIIVSMLEKGYNPASLWSAVLSAVLCVESLGAWQTSRDRLDVLELGCGAGWSTLILYNLLLQYFGDRFALHSADNSPYAIACTSRMLSQFHIPYRIVEDGGTFMGKTSEDRENRPTVILWAQDFASVLDQHDAESICSVYSNHGTAYLEPPKHGAVLEKIHRVLVSSGTFVTDSLDPNTSLSLSKRFVIGSILRGNNRERFGRFSVDQRYVFEAGSDGIKMLRIMRDESAAGFLDWLNYLLYNGHIGTFRKYLGVLQRSVDSQRKMRELVRVSSNDLRMIVGKVDQSWQVLSTPVDTLQVPYIQTLQIRKLGS